MGVIYKKQCKQSLMLKACKMSYMQMYKKYVDFEKSLKKDDDLIGKLEDTLLRSRRSAVNRGPISFMSGVFCGSREDAWDESVIKRHRITHVLNCAARNNIKPEECSAEHYLGLEALDEESYPIIRIFYDKAKKFIDAALKEGGRVLVHCELGMNRSVTLCLAYKIYTEKCNLFEAVSDFSSSRPNILTNKSFRKQLIEFASQHGLV